MRRGLAIAGGAMLAAALLSAPALAQFGADGPKPGAARPAVPAAPRPVAPRAVPPPPAAPQPTAQPPGAAAEDPLVAATGDRMLPPQLRGLRDTQPPEPELVARRAGLRLRTSRPTDLRNTGTPPSAAEFGALLAPPR
ncbi:hypothetical protein GCM10011504_18130 [Siccirubricoccus deserti]|uniref:Uncharacterized protein n=1 Tax=Siccirubricoccus deserti TaxID=2013562 RepID=A0A9X0UHA0_9PROT|nr:hypothetical protein [Siccirubricoccus deserti]MBC4016030.1 hypothetical protein [Siccirubricoccus deserti]GGC40093.1 hypothetical protein GCM10011504_18130 [Siccirubricoccus deserti]